MVEHDFKEHKIEDDGSEVIVANFHGLCDVISNLDSKIAGALIIKDGKVLAASNGAGSTLPSDEYLSKLIRQAEVLVGIPLANRPFFGDLNFVLVSYERLDSMLFYLKNQKVILGVGLLPPYDLTVLSSKIQKLLEDNYWLRQTHSIT